MGTIFKGVDELMSEEVPQGYFLMLVGPPAVGKGIFAAQYAHQGILLDESVVYFITDSPPSEARKIMLRYGWDTTEYEKEGIFRFIDCFSWRTGGPYDEKYSITDPTNLTDVTITIDQAMKGLTVPVRVVLDSFSSVAWLVTPTVAIKFLQGIDGRLKKHNYNGLYVVEMGMHDEMTMATLRAQSDGILEVRVVEEEHRLQRYFRIFTIRGIECSTIWVPWKITRSGIVFGSK